MRVVSSVLLAAGFLVGSVALSQLHPAADESQASGELMKRLRAAEAARSQVPLARIEVRLSSSVAIPMVVIDAPPVLALGGARLAAEYDELAAAAEGGNVGAATALAEALVTCSRAYSDGVDVERPPTAAIIGPYELCKGTTPHQPAMTGRWIDRAVELGSVPMIVEAFARATTHSEKLALQQRLWSQGDPGALLALAELHEQRATATAEDDDRVHALAYRLVFNGIFAEALKARYSPLRARVLEASKERAAELQAFLTPEQRQAAIRLASDAIARNGGRTFPL